MAIGDVRRKTIIECMSIGIGGRLMTILFAEDRWKRLIGDAPKNQVSKRASQSRI
ncbi:hypothetical protein ACS0TY_016649 [Phlomoides rotata]